MYIKSMRASFGGLENASMELEQGLNIIEAPNESGKSTWCGFIRTMLYGIDTARRVKKGTLPDKKRFLPWGNYPMAGTMDISWRGGEVTLSRSGGAGKPMGACEASLSGTAQRVPELCGKAPGEMILGVPESVFVRSAFISGGAMSVDSDAELEKRISSLITGGSEDESYSAAREILHNRRVKRRHNARVGRAAELEGLINEKKAALAAIESENARLGGMFEEREKALVEIALLERELSLHEAARLRSEREKIAAAKEALAAAEEELNRLKAEAGDISAQKLNAAREAVSRYREAAAEVKTAAEAESRYKEAKSAADEARRAYYSAREKAGGVSEEGVAAAERSLIEYENVRKSAERSEQELRVFKARRSPAEAVAQAPKWLLAAGIALIALGVIAEVMALAGLLSNVLHIAAGAVGITGAAMLIVFAVKRSDAENRRRAAEDAARAEGEIYEKLARDAAEAAKSAETELRAALDRIGAEGEPQTARGHIKERADLLEVCEQARTELDAAEKIAAGLAPAPKAMENAVEGEERAAQELGRLLGELGIDPAGNITVGIEAKSALLTRLGRAEADYEAAARLAASLGEIEEAAEAEEDLPAPTMDKETAGERLDLVRGRAAALERELALSEGQLRHLGDPMVAATELENLERAYAENEEEYEALTLAIEVLDEANAELQQRFSPIVGSLAGKLMSAMTDGVYDSVSFDREFSFTAAKAGQTAREAEYLSAGTLAQLYLAARLAICLLALPEEEKCPIILDDALLGFDDKRAKAALELLRELSKERQIILFTCQSREKLLLDQ